MNNFVASFLKEIGLPLEIRSKQHKIFCRFMIHLNIQIMAAPFCDLGKGTVVGWGWEMPPSSSARGGFQLCVRKEETVGWRKWMRTSSL